MAPGDRQSVEPLEENVHQIVRGKRRIPLHDLRRVPAGTARWDPETTCEPGNRSGAPRARPGDHADGRSTTGRRIGPDAPKIGARWTRRTTTKDEERKPPSVRTSACPA